MSRQNSRLNVTGGHANTDQKATNQISSKLSYLIVVLYSASAFSLIAGIIIAVESKDSSLPPLSEELGLLGGACFAASAYYQNRGVIEQKNDRIAIEQEKNAELGQATALLTP